MEPLNLVKRKNRPVAVVAPSTVVSPPVMAAATAPVFPSGLLSSLYMNSMLNDQLFQRAAAAAQYGTTGTAASSFWTPANRFWQVMQQHNSAAQQYAAAAAAAAAVVAASATTATATATATSTVTTTASNSSSCSSSSTSSSCTATATSTAIVASSSAAAANKDDRKRSVSPANSCSGSAARPQNDHSKNSSCSDGSKHHDTVQNSNNQDKKKPHIKKPLNAFMLYMKEMRAKVVAECTLKESAAINQILGRRWHSLSRDEQAKYYEKARQERQLHMELYPGWSARDNYGYGAKKKKRKKERVPVIDAGSGGSPSLLIGIIFFYLFIFCFSCPRANSSMQYRSRLKIFLNLRSFLFFYIPLDIAPVVRLLNQFKNDVIPKPVLVFTQQRTHINNKTFSGSIQNNIYSVLSFSVYRTLSHNINIYTKIYGYYNSKYLLSVQPLKTMYKPIYFIHLLISTISQ
ncbi:hypothetical protein AGLY_005018 [Aphis glycines]|uniref:dTCF n=1 Tax=Aphis glycines TaxID=307491 RepID=A0A6G0TWT8_APHGL|nr:hypothetical protein AGLY_005018 [Aphis glycines]